jgi:hypothetical protein
MTVPLTFGSNDMTLAVGWVVSTAASRSRPAVPLTVVKLPPRNRVFADMLRALTVLLVVGLKLVALPVASAVSNAATFARDTFALTWPNDPPA